MLYHQLLQSRWKSFKTFFTCGNGKRSLVDRSRLSIGPEAMQKKLEFRKHILSNPNKLIMPYLLTPRLFPQQSRPFSQGCFRPVLALNHLTHTSFTSPWPESARARNKSFGWSLIFLGTGLIYVTFCRGHQVELMSTANNHSSSSPPILSNLKIEDGKQSSVTWRSFWHSVKAYFIEPIATAGRFLYLLALFFPVLLTSPVLLLEYIHLAHPAQRRQSVKSQNFTAERRCTRWWYNLLVKSMQMAGPTFIKLAQWAGSRTDLFPATLCQSLGRLHSNGKPHSMAYTRRVIEKAFGKRFEDIFVSFDPEPLGVGAVAQVYKATLDANLLPLSYLEPKHSDNQAQDVIKKLSKSLTTPDEPPSLIPSTSVAIKVLHPRVSKNIKRDLKIMTFFANLINFFPGAEWLSFPEEVQVFGELMKSQIDLRLEAENLKRFETNFANRESISFPRPLMSYTTEKVLVEEFQDALPLKYFLKEGGGAFDKRISNIGLDAFLHMLLIDNFVHSDLHPGNIMVKFYKPVSQSIWQSLLTHLCGKVDAEARSDDSELLTETVHKLRKAFTDPSQWILELERLDNGGYQPEVVFIDSGLVTELSDKNQRNFLDLFEAIASFDGYQAGKLMIERCRTPDLVTDEETFAMKIQHLCLKVKAQTFSLSKIKIADVLLGVLTAVREHHVKLEADFVNTILSILLLEGIGRQLNPDIDLFQSALPILRSLGRKINTVETIYQGVSTKKLGSMFKVWFWLEARHIANVAASEVDYMLRYDFLTPNI